jgi:integrase
MGPRIDRRLVTRTCRSRTAATAALAELREQRRRRLSPVDQSLGAYLRWWLDQSAQPSISPNTFRGYEDVLPHFAAIADIPLAELTPEHIEGVLNAMTVQRGHTTAPAAPKTIRNAQVMLRRALGQAELRGHIRRNVAALVPLRRVPRVSRDSLGPERARAILAAVAGDRYEAAYALAFLGLRVGEVLGLLWSDLDLSRAVVNVRYQLVGSGPGAARAQTKSAAAEAPVPLPPFVVERLGAHRARQDAERPVAVLRDEDRGLLFVTPSGYAVNGSWLTKHFQALLAEAGLPRMRLHDLRHGAASLLVGAGVHPRIAQQLLRHASSRTTMDVYAHVSAAQEREAADVLQRVLAQ